uniref:Uncharacterized protein n=1 Tax=Astatotilapia calliptera TaxID=8154 RepID=A0AAX7SYA0_ASTCA
PGPASPGPASPGPLHRLLCRRHCLPRGRPPELFRRRRCRPHGRPLELHCVWAVFLGFGVCCALLLFSVVKGNYTAVLQAKKARSSTNRSKLEKHILDFINDNDKGDVDDAILWESMKAVIRGHIISFSSAKRKSQEMALKDLESNIQQLEQTYQSSPKIELLGKITKLKCEYNSLLSKQVCLQITKCKQTFF